MISIDTNKILNAPEFHIMIFAFLLNFVWELLQMPLFGGFSEYQYYQIILHCTKATFGDVIISLVAFAGACLVTRSRMWIISMSRSGVVSFLVIGLVITIAFELLATGPINRWQYDELMPMIPVIGVGVSPVAQWPTPLFFRTRHHRVPSNHFGHCSNSLSIRWSSSLSRPSQASAAVRWRFGVSNRMTTRHSPK